MDRNSILPLMLAFLLTASCAAEGDGDIQAQIRDLQAGQKAIRNELETIKDILLGKQPPLDNVSVHIADAPSVGSLTATIGIVEFADFQCPYCARHFKEVYPQIYAEYIKTGRVRYFFLDFPLDSVHPAAPKAAEAVHCAAAQGRFSEMHDRLFGNQASLSAAELAGHAGAIGLDVVRFQLCLDAGTYLTDVRNDIAEGQRLGVEATPSFFLGTVNPVTGTMTATAMLKGAQPYAVFRDALVKLTTSK